jgi:hypothetical protein
LHSWDEFILNPIEVFGNSTRSDCSLVNHNVIIASGRFIDSWAELDEPILDLPEEERSQLFEGYHEFFEGDVDRYVLRFEEEMSTGSL